MYVQLIASRRLKPLRFHMITSDYVFLYELELGGDRDKKEEEERDYMCGLTLL